MEKLKNIVSVSGVLTIKSGLSIGGSKEGLGVDTKDNPIIRNPLSNKPYIPGSSIKGKMRSLFEQYGLAKGGSFPCKCGRKECVVCTLFGAHMNVKGESGTPRLMFRDSMLAPEFEDLFDEEIVEIKTETMIDRNTGTAATGSLRTKERIAAGVKFNYSIDILVFENDNENKLVEYVKQGLKFIELTGLGSKISAGYGQIDFDIENIKITKKL